MRVTRSRTIRYTLNVNRLIPGVAPIHGAVVESATDQGIMAEQTIFAPHVSTLRSAKGLSHLSAGTGGWTSVRFVHPPSETR
jgi:hypothetical protein